ncbi:MAG: NUDIX domain-containing protein [archaeon]
MADVLDIVNENDQIIGKASRDYIHKNILIHRGVIVWVVNSKDQLLVEKRATHRAYFPGYYDVSVGGQVEAGESYEAAAQRELKEEVGIKGKLHFIASYDEFSDNHKEKRRVYVCCCEGPFKPEAREMKTVRFLSRDQIKRLMEKDEAKFTPDFRIAFELYLESEAKQGFLCAIG